MSDSRRSSVRQITITSEPDQMFFLKLDWADDLGSGFVIHLSDGVSAWTGEVSEEDVSREALDMEMDRERYVHDLHLALTGEGETGYSFHLTPERPRSPLLQLSYEKVQNDISFRLGMVGLQPVPEPSEVIRDFISHTLDLNARLKAKNQHLLDVNEKLRKEHEYINSEMERYVLLKENLEKELYSRFVLLMNEKKAKLRSLRERVNELEEALEKGQSTKVDTEEEKAKVSSAEESPAIEESDYEGSTEEEEEPQPSCSHSRPPQTERSESPMDDSLHDITDVAPCRKRRHRHLQNLENQHKRAMLDRQQISRERPTEETKAEKSKTPSGRVKPANPPNSAAAANPDPDHLFDDI